MRKLTIALLLTISTGCAVYRAHSAPLAVNPKDAPTKDAVDRCYADVYDRLAVPHQYTYTQCVEMELKYKNSRPLARFLLKLREHFPFFDAGQDEGAMH